MNARLERRKDPKPRLTITQILDLMQRLADEQHGGNLEDNALTVFSQLSTGDKRTFLRKSLLSLWRAQIELAEAGLQEIVIDQETRIDQDAVLQERQSLDAMNKAEQIRLKTWMSKTLFVMGILIFGGVILLTTMLGGGSWEGLLKHLEGILKLLI